MESNCSENENSKVPLFPFSFFLYQKWSRSAEQKVVKKENALIHKKRKRCA